MRFLLPFLFILIHMSAQAQSFKKLVDKDTEKTYYQGKVSFEDLKFEPLFTWYQKNADYTPNEDVVSELSAVLETYNIELAVFLGTWCSDSHELVPKLERVLEECSYPMNDVPMYALDLEKNSLDGIEQKYRIEYVPTIILTRKNEEIGRIVETVKETLEIDMLRIIIDYTSDIMDHEAE